MKEKQLESSKLTVDEAYIIYKLRSDPSLWETLNKYIRPNGTVRTESEVKKLKENIKGVFDLN